MKLTIKNPSAWLPLSMSFVALAIVLGHLAVFGIVRGGDEGAAAHLFQILMLAQVPIIIFFAIKWLPRTPMQTLGILALQIIAALTAFAPVFFLSL